MDKKERDRIMKAKGFALGSLYDLNESTSMLNLSEDERLRIQHMIQTISRIIQYRVEAQVGLTKDCGCSGCGCQ